MCCWTVRLLVLVIMISLEWVKHSYVYLIVLFRNTLVTETSTCVNTKNSINSKMKNKDCQSSLSYCNRLVAYWLVMCALVASSITSCAFTNSNVAFACNTHFRDKKVVIHSWLNNF